MNNITKKALTLVLVFLLLATLAFIWGNSMLPKVDSAKISGGLLEKLRPILSVFHIYPKNDNVLRKIAHFVEFGALGAELCLIVGLNVRITFQRASGCAYIALLTALTDEMIQLYTGRGSQVQDVVLDYIGALFGIGAVILVLSIVRRRRSEKKA